MNTKYERMYNLLLSLKRDVQELTKAFDVLIVTLDRGFSGKARQTDGGIIVPRGVKHQEKVIK